MDLSVLKSGSDIRGTATEGVEGQPIELTSDIVRACAAAFLGFLYKKTGKTADKLILAVGYDSRLSGKAIARDVRETFLLRGASVYDTGLSSTPAMFMTTLKNHLNCDASVMVTASHMPFNKNGLKFFTKEGGLEGADIGAILTAAQNISISALRLGAPGVKRSKDVKMPFMDEYAALLVRKVTSAAGALPLSGLKIIVDAGNGAGGFFAEKVLKPLGADTAGSQFLKPDGRFPNHIPNPENAEAMQSISAAVLKHKADLGIIFDTDVDRAAIVAADGKEINKSRLIALISAVLIAEQPGCTVVTDSITSDGLTQFISARGGQHHRFKRGYRNVINEARRLNAEGIHCPLAIETSGHAAFKENFFLDDGAYLITRLLITMAQLSAEGRPLTSLIADLAEPAEEKEIRMGFTVPDFKPYGIKLLDSLRQFAKREREWKPAEKDYEGIRVSFGKEDGDGWFLLRLSLHDPILPLNIESNTPGGAKVIAGKLLKFLQDFDGVDTAPLRAFAGEGNA